MRIQRKMNNENLRPFQKGNKFGKGRIKGSKNRKTVLSAWMNFWYQYDKKIEKENRDRINKRRRELYKLKKDQFKKYLDQ